MSATRMKRQAIAAVLVLASSVCVALPAGAPASQISAGERAALISLYQATGGPQWHKQKGWLGPEGTECEWYGVECATVPTAKASTVRAVRGLDLRDNNLNGSLPTALGELELLVAVHLDGNAVQQPVPTVLVERWESGLLEFTPSSLLNDLEEMRVVSRAEASRCAGRTTRLLGDGSVEVMQKACSPRGAGRREDCTRRAGRVLGVPRLSRLLDHQQFFAADVPSDSRWSDVGATVIFVKTRSRSREVIIRRNAPLQMWTVLMAFEGVIAGAEWAGAAVSGSCE
jgi:hypothetical protein